MNFHFKKIFYLWEISVLCLRAMSATHVPLAADMPARLAVKGVRRPRRASEDLRVPVKLDTRTKLSRAAEAFRHDPISHVGGKPNAVQTALINQAVQLQMRVLAMDAAFVDNGGQSAHDAKQYLAWANAITRLLGRLGIKGAAEKPPSLAELLGAPASPPPEPAAAPACNLGGGGTGDALRRWREAGGKPGRPPKTKAPAAPPAASAATPRPRSRAAEPTPNE
jgi:hypothetical protein